MSLRNSHSLFPTFTTANASGMATGHALGDTGDFSNTIYAGFPVPGANNSSTPFLENDVVLGDVDAHFAGNYLDEATILKLARDKGYSTASIGKIGPVLIFDPTERSGEQTIIVDDATGTPKGIPLSADLTQRLQAASLPVAAPGRGANGNRRQYDHARHDGRQCRAAGLLRGRRIEGGAAAVQGPQQAVRAGVLVARSRRQPAQSGRQPQHAGAWHQRADLARGDP